MAVYVRRQDCCKVGARSRSPDAARCASRTARSCLRPGAPMTGVTFTGELPKSNYEVRFEAARIDGNDFFASLTFPVGDSFCTWVTGGWGGDIVGLSSLDGWDASDNETRTYSRFRKGALVRTSACRSRPTRITGWIDEQADRQRADHAAARLACGPARIQLSAPTGFCLVWHRRSAAQNRLPAAALG
mgnify:CR=1 FL=1